MRNIWILALFAGCVDPVTDGKTDTDPVGTDTGDADTDTDTDADADTDPVCGAAVVSTIPAADAVDVYYRGRVEVSFDSDATGALVEIRDSAGTVVEGNADWQEGNVQAFLYPVLAANTPYTLHVEVCDVATDLTFTTSELGSPLAVDATVLTDRTYVFRLADAVIREPAFLNAVADQFLTVPLLFGITASDATTIDMLGALGFHEDDGSYTQQPGQSTWDFPAGDFSSAPYFSARADAIVITYADIPIPVEGFTLAGTFTADGTEIREGVATGLADSRYMGELIRQPDVPDAICDVAAAAGVVCEPCGDGEPYCLYIEAEKITATWQEGLVIEPVE